MIGSSWATSSQLSGRPMYVSVVSVGSRPSRMRPLAASQYLAGSKRRSRAASTAASDSGSAVTKKYEAGPIRS